MYQFLQSHLVEIFMIVLSADRLAERIWPNSATLKAIDKAIAAIGGKDADGQ